MGTDVLQVLFNSGDLRLTLEEYGKSIRREVEAAPEGHVVQVDVEGWTKGLTGRYRSMPPF